MLKSHLLAALGILGAAGVQPTPRMSLAWPSNPRNRGKARPAGSKLARKAFKGTVGVKSGPSSLRPRMDRPYPFSAKR